MEAVTDFLLLGSKITLHGDRSHAERIRTYNFPQNRLTDHRINLTLYSLDGVMEGKLDEVVAALQAKDIELRLAAMSGTAAAPGEDAHGEA